MKPLTIIFSLLLSLSCSSQTAISESVKVATFCKVWGFLKYYHPAVATGKIDWDKEFTTRADVLHTLTTKQALNGFYADWINSIGAIK